MGPRFRTATPTDTAKVAEEGRRMIKHVSIRERWEGNNSTPVPPADVVGGRAASKGTIDGDAILVACLDDYSMGCSRYGIGATTCPISFLPRLFP